MAKGKAVPVEKTVWENPLVPHRRLREMYTAMLGARLLDEWATSRTGSGRGRKPVVASTRGEEACRVSTLIGLEKGDLVMDPAESLTTNYLLGAGGKGLGRASGGDRSAKLEDGRRGRRLRLGSSAPVEEILRMAVGAGLALKEQGQGRVLVAYAPGDGVGMETWSQVLRATARTGASVVFVVLPGRAKAGVLSARATRLGVPGIAVEADDAVALYRVAQESAVRIRMGGGPVLMECVRVNLGTERRRTEREDCLETMACVLVTKGAAAEGWADRMGATLGTRLLGQLEAGL